MPATKIRIKGCGVNVCKIASGETSRCLVITVLVMSDKISQEAEPGESNSGKKKKKKSPSLAHRREPSVRGETLPFSQRGVKTGEKAAGELLLESSFTANCCGASTP